VPQKNPDGRKPKFPWKKASKGAFRAGCWGAATGAGSGSVTGSPTKTVIFGVIGFVGGAGAHFHGEIVKHREDDPLPVFDDATTFLFDTVMMIVCLLLFVFPAMQLDRTVWPGEALPGYFGFAALFISCFLIPVMRGLICNLGLAREPYEGERRDTMPM
jgi:hypothetical protein